MTPEARIGPNAVLQLADVVRQRRGEALLNSLLHGAGLGALPSPSGMIPEGDAARLHQYLRQALPNLASDWTAEAGVRTGHYILAHRIPRAAQAVLRTLPPALAAPLLAKAIARHAWTFAGSGQFEALNPWRFAIHDNPVVRGETSQTCLCHWHSAVFETLYTALVSPRCRCGEVQCCAQPNQSACVFSITRR